MAEQVLGVLNVHNPPTGSSLSAGDNIIVKFDDGGFTIKVYLNNVLTTTPADIGLLGSNFTILYGISSYNGFYGVSVYSYCNGPNLLWFTMNTQFPLFPYFNLETTVDSPVCDVGGGVVCDIIFNAPLAITHSTDLTSNNGQVVASAISSNGTVKYGLEDFVYSSGGQTSGTFTGLSPGFYTIYAKDENDCTAQLNFTVLFAPAYAEHYRFTWDNIKVGNGSIRTGRVRIYEREYIGDVLEVESAGASPFKLFKPKQEDLNNKFFAVHPTNALLTLRSKFDYQFLPLFTQDNKKFKVVYEVDEGSGFNIIWTGFIIPSVYRERFVAAQYPVELQIADNIASLKDELFTDDNGNLLNGKLKLIKVISHCLAKTGLQLNIRSGINIFEVTHDTAATDDPLDQTYIDVACYRRQGKNGIEAFSCWDVLKAILTPFGARIYQYDNVWILEEIDRAHAAYAYRVFDYTGAYVSNSTFDPVIDIKKPTFDDRVALIDQDHSMEVIPAYGKINVVSLLNYVGSITAGGFEKTDLLSPEAETFNLSQGIFTSEEGFKDWTLRLNGTTGVNFGRVQIGTQGREGDITQRLKGDFGRSVGAFYFNVNSWSGNLRDAYIESAEKPYQYGPGDELKLSFEYSTPARTEFEFMVLRFVVKLGNDYLQQDLSWDTDEYIYRAYPKPSNSLQKFELSVPAPDTTTVVETTVQIRIYFYARHFFDHGLPPDPDGDNAQDGLASLRAVPTDNVRSDIRYDVRNEFTINGNDAVRRLFYELRVNANLAEDIPECIRPDDFNSVTNPNVFRLLSEIQDNDELTNRNRGIDVKFYVDNVALDALINGQEPPVKQTVALNISRYINENLDVELYNFDCPDITNAKNMYNNFFRLADESPTTLWTRSGIAEQLPLQHILLKVLGANHSAPTFRLTGSFINEFARIGMNKYLRLTKPGSSLSASNTTFTSNLNGWSQTGSGEAFAWSSSNSGSAEVTLSGAEDSQKIYQQINHAGGYIVFTVNVKVIPTAENDREDVLWVLFFQNSSIIHAEKMKTFAAPTSETDYNFNYTAFAPGSVTRIGFYLKNVNGTEDVTYQFGEFTPEGTDLEEVYQISDYASDEKNHKYFFELMQLSKTYVSLQGTDQGGDNQNGDEEGEAFDGAYSSAYGGAFDTITN